MRYKYFKCAIFFMGLNLFGVLPAFCQNASYSEIMKELNLIRQKFVTSPGGYMSCNMSFLYSSESKPTAFIDSLKGIYKVNGSDRYLKIANAETVQNDSITLSIYNDDKVLMVTKPSQNMSGGQNLMVGNMDSAFVVRNAKSVTITQKNGLKTMSFVFSDSSQFYDCQLVYDSKTYIPVSLSYILKTSKSHESFKPPADGALITIRYSGYSNASFDTSILKVNHYVVIANGGVSSKPGYSGYNLIHQGEIPGITK